VGNHDEGEEQKRFEKPGGKQSAIGKKTVRGFPGQASAGAAKGGADRGDELVPGRRPLDQELGRLVELGRFFELESVGHGELSNVDLRGLKPVLIRVFTRR
jgi:hypothetical protein